MISTVIDQSLGLEFPIFQGGMAWVADASLAAGVSNAGGLGIIAAMNSNGEQLREEIRKCKTMTDKIFGVNIMLMSPFAEEVSDVVVEEGIKVITTGAGNPGKYIPMWKEAGIKVIPVVAAAVLAKHLAPLGVDAVIAEGTESGGHVGEMTTMALVPQVVDAVDVPVIAAGGIADGRQLAAAFALGACGVQVGACLLVRASVWDEVKGLDEKFAVAFNDVDFCLRVRDAGYRIAWTPYAELIHYESKSRGGDEKDPLKAARFAAEQQRLYTIHGKENILDDPYYNPNLTRDREDFSESDDLRRLKEGRVTVRFRGGTLQ